MAKRKSTRGKTTIYKAYLYSKRSSYRSPTKDRCELGCSKKVGRSWFISGNRRVNIVAHPILSREWVNDHGVLSISGIYWWSLWHRYTITVNQVMVVTVTFSKWWLHLYQQELLISVASMLAESSTMEIMIGTTNSGISYQLRDVYSICRCFRNVATYKWRFTMGKFKSSLLS